MYYLFPVTTWELISQSLRLLCHWRSLAADFVLEAAFLVFFFSYFPHTPFFLCQFLLNWTFCHQTRFITGARVERNSAEIRIRFLLRLGHVRRGFRPCGSFPCRWVRVGGGGSFHPYWERKGVGIQKEIQRGLKGSWDASPVAWIPSLKLYLLIHVTFKSRKHWRFSCLSVQSDYRPRAADLECALTRRGQRLQWAGLSTTAIPPAVQYS